MARLDKAVRDSLVADIHDKLPPGWAVTSGGVGHARIQLDQDGRKNPTEFHRIGTFIIVAQHLPDGAIEAELFERVKFPPGYTEARKKIETVCTVMGRGWKKQLIEAMVAKAFEQQGVYEERQAVQAAKDAAREAKKKAAKK